MKYPTFQEFATMSSSSPIHQLLWMAIAKLTSAEGSRYTSMTPNEVYDIVVNTALSCYGTAPIFTPKLP